MRPEDFASYDDGTPFGQEQTTGKLWLQTRIHLMRRIKNPLIVL